MSGRDKPAEERDMSRRVRVTADDGTTRVRVLPPEGHGEIWRGSAR